MANVRVVLCSITASLHDAIRANEDNVEVRHFLGSLKELEKCSLSLFPQLVHYLVIPSQ